MPKYALHSLNPFKAHSRWVGTEGEKKDQECVQMLLPPAQWRQNSKEGNQMYVCMYLSFITHRNLNKNHGVALVRLLQVIRLERRIYRNGFDILPLNPQATEAKENSICRLKEEEVDTKIDKELKRWCNVLCSEINPANIDSMRQVAHTECWRPVWANKVPTHHMCPNFNT
jgi:hypothetical protein